MKAEVVREPWMRSVAVYVRERDRLWIPPSDPTLNMAGEWVDSQPGVEPDRPSFRFSYDVSEALAAGLMDAVEPNSSVVAHLKDAIGVRDRLLSMVEFQVERSVGGEAT